VAVVAHIALVHTASRARGTRIPSNAAFMTLVRRFAALGAQWHNSPVRRSSSRRGFLPLTAVAAGHSENRGYEEYWQRSHCTTSRLDNHRNCSSPRCRRLLRCSRSTPNKPTQDPYTYLRTLAPSANNAPAPEPHRAFRNHPYQGPTMTMCSHRAEGRARNS
jgi:hypothetical protein